MTESQNKLMEGLTEPQQAAVEHQAGPLLILAGPGSGKTRVVTHRIARLLEKGVESRSILALTFTNKAADEMRRRVAGLAPDATVWMGTFHRFGAQLLRRYGRMTGVEENFTIFDTEDSQKVLKQALIDLDLDLQYATPRQVAAGISDAKSKVATPDRYQPKLGDPVGRIVQEVYPRYQALLRQSNAVDFDDLLLLPACLLRDNPELRTQLDHRYSHIMVDEYQDTNLAQYAIVRALSNDQPNLAVTGDPDQSIYAWRGATIANILQFERDYDQVAVVKLEQNFRSSPSILRAADALISNNRQRKPKQLITDNPEGEPVRQVCYQDQNAEAVEIAAKIANDLEDQRVAAEEIAIFYRVNSLSRSLEHALRSQGVPYQIVHGVEFYQRKEIKDLVAYLQLLNNPRNDIALLRVINTPPRGIGQRTIQRLRTHAELRKLSLLDACREAGAIKSLKSRAAVAVAKFVHILDSLSILMHRPVEEILGRVIIDSGIRDHLEGSQLEEDQERVANVNELLAAAREFDEQHAEASLDAFLEQTALVNDTDQWDGDSGRVTLMTLHAAKGLEFDHVYIVGVEQGLIPHERSREDPMGEEEERRLLFVGITRARHELQLSHTLRRPQRGGTRNPIPSAFLLELPRDEMVIHEPPRSYRYAPDIDEMREEWEELEAQEWDPDAPSTTDVVENPALTSAAAASAIQSASEMLGAPDAKPGLAPEAYEHGMLVRHPEYGIGTIVALSGKGKKRQASVRFIGPQPVTDFVLAYAKLHPIKGKAKT